MMFWHSVIQFDIAAAAAGCCGWCGCLPLVCPRSTSFPALQLQSLFLPEQLWWLWWWWCPTMHVVLLCGSALKHASAAQRAWLMACLLCMQYIIVHCIACKLSWPGSTHMPSPLLLAACMHPQAHPHGLPPPPHRHRTAPHAQRVQHMACSHHSTLLQPATDG